MAHFTGTHLLALNPNPDLHGRSVGHVQATFEGKQVSNMDRPVKVDSFYRCGHHIGPGKPGGNDKGGIVNERLYGLSLLHNFKITNCR